MPAETLPPPQAYSRALGQMVEFRPAQLRPGVPLVRHNLGTIDTIATPGTCGDPTRPEFRSWRRENFLPVLQRYGLGEGDMANPELPHWTPHDGWAEAILFARATESFCAVTNESESFISLVEAGIGFCRSPYQNTGFYMADIAGAPEKSRRARLLAAHIFDVVAAAHPAFFRIEQSIEALATRAALAMVDRRRLAQSQQQVHIEYRTPTHETLWHDNSVYLSGSCGQKKPRWMEFVGAKLHDYGIPYDDSFRPQFDEHHIAQELTHKLYRPVQLVAIGEDSDALGALAELGPRLVHAEDTQQAFGICIQPRRGQSPESTANGTRQMAMWHLRLLQEDGIGNFFLTDSLEALAMYGILQHQRHMQRLNTSR